MRLRRWKPARMFIARNPSAATCGKVKRCSTPRASSNGTFKEYGNGIVGDMCVHMLDTARWMLKLGWPKKITSAGGIFVQKEGKSNISDTQTATFEYDNFDAVWQHRTWGSPPDPDYPWAVFIYGDKGTLKASTMRADFIPLDKGGKKLHFDCVFEREQYPED